MGTHQKKRIRRAGADRRAGSAKPTRLGLLRSSDSAERIIAAAGFPANTKVASPLWADAERQFKLERQQVH